jgi:hypothetical protein
MANTYTTETVLQRVKLGVNDNGAAPVWLTDVLYNTFIANAVVSENQPYRFTLYGTGLWKLDGDMWGGNPYVLHFATPAAPFTGNGTTATYNTSCWGSIMTTATDTTPYYEVTGCKVDYAAIMCELNMWLAQHRALQIASQNGQDVGVTAKYLIDTANRWAGSSGGGDYYGGIR